jgi:hypothetical protein
MQKIFDIDNKLLLSNNIRQHNKIVLSLLILFNNKEYRLSNLKHLNLKHENHLIEMHYVLMIFNLYNGSTFRFKGTRSPDRLRIQIFEQK